MEAPAPPDDGAHFLLRLLADGIRPDPRRTTAEWAQAERVVSEGAAAGRWRNERAPYLTEIMERCSLHCPTRRVSVMGSAQCGKTQVGLNLQGQILSETPAQCLVVLPSLNSLRMYNRDKLARMIDATPALARSVADVVERAGGASTMAVKIGARGAQVELVVASSSRDLQSRTSRVVILEEISEYEADVGGRGDPVDQALARTIQWRKRGEKVVDISTPGEKQGSSNRPPCRITKLYDAGSGGRYLVPCPHCEHRQALRFPQLHWTPGEPEGARYACESCGVLIDPRELPRMLAAGQWVHERPELLDRHASYHINTLYSPFTPWSEFAKEAEKAESNPTAQKTFAQQWLGEAWDATYDLPKAEILILRRDNYPTGRVPPSVLFLTGATDVQTSNGGWLAWAVWGFDRQFGQWLIETGTIEGDPTRPEVWAKHSELLRRSWTDAWGKPMQPIVWGVDSGHCTPNVYNYARHYGHDRAPKLRVLKGEGNWFTPPLGTSKLIDYDWNGEKIRNGVAIWHVGTWAMKSELASALQRTETGPENGVWPAGALRFNGQADRNWLDQLLAEQCFENPSNGSRYWKKVGPRNEAWDLAVYARALAHGAADSMTEGQWAAVEAERLGPPEAAQADLLAMLTPTLKQEAEAAVKRKATDDAKREEAARQPPPPATIWGPSPRWEAPRPW